MIKELIQSFLYIFIPILIPLLLIYKFDKQEDGSGCGIFGWLLFKAFERGMKNGKSSFK